MWWIVTSLSHHSRRQNSKRQSFKPQKMTSSRKGEAKYEKPKDTLQRGNNKPGITIEIDQPKEGQKYTNKRNAARE